MYGRGVGVWGHASSPENVWSIIRLRNAISCILRAVLTKNNLVNNMTQLMQRQRVYHRLLLGWLKTWIAPMTNPSLHLEQCQVINEKCLENEK
jgi:hypothetical protein